jgi:hypothetical protein
MNEERRSSYFNLSIQLFKTLKAAYFAIFSAFI